MIFARRTLVGFALGCVAVVGAVVLFTDSDHWRNIDPLTGERIPSAAQRLSSARASGDVVVALAILDRIEDEEGRSAELAATRALLNAELFVGWQELAPEHPGFDAAATRRLERAGALRSLRARSTRWTASTIGAAIDQASGDEAVAAALHDFFRSSRAPKGPSGIDARAADAAQRGWSAEEASALADGYVTAGRVRAALRWRARAWSVRPQADTTLRLLEALRSAGEYESAGAVMGFVGAPDAAWRRHRAEFAAWSRNTLEEVRALEALAASDEATPEDQSRLVDLWIFLGQPERALPHAVALAQLGGGRVGQRWRLPILLALEAGDTGRALELIHSSAAQALGEDERTELELEILSGDLRLDELQARLGELSRTPRSKYADDYEALLRRRNDREALLSWLVHRIERGAREPELLDEALGLAHALQRPETIGWLLDRGGASDPIRELARLPSYRRAGVPNSKERVLAALNRRPLTEDEVLAGLELLRRRDYEPVWFDALTAHSPLEAASGRLVGSWFDALVQHDEGGARSLLREVAAAQPDSPALQRVVVQRATWIGDVDLELQSRARLSALDPADEENIAQEVHTLIAANRPREAVEVIRARYTPQTLAVAPLAVQDGALEAALDANDAFWLVSWTTELAARPDASAAHLSELAARLVVADLQTQAQELLQRALMLEPGNEPALAYLGRSYLREDETVRALAALEQLSPEFLALNDEASFDLCEAQWTSGKRVAARAGLERLARPLRIDDRSLVRRLRRAVALLRIGQTEEGLAELTAVSADPRATLDEQLTLVDALQEHQPGPALDAKLRALLVAHPNDPRVLVRSGRAAMAAARYAEGIAAFKASRSTGAPGGATSLELADALATAGDERAALALVQTERVRLPGSLAVAALAHELEVSTSPTLGLYGTRRIVGEDRASRWLARGTISLGGGGTRVAVAAGRSVVSGRAAAADEGRTALRRTYLEAWAAAERRLARGRSVSVGFHGFPDGTGPTGLSPWLAYRAVNDQGGRAWSIRGFFGELLDDPAAGVALGGRRSGIELDLSRRFDERWSLDLMARYQRVTVAAGRYVSDAASGEDARAGVTLAYDLLGAGRLVTDMPTFERVPRFDALPVAGSPYWKSRHEALLAFASLDAQRMTGGDDVAALLPIADRSSSGLVGARYDRALRPGLAAMVGAAVGKGLERGESLYRGDLGVHWRPSFEVEVFLAAEIGRSNNRGTSEEGQAWTLGLHLRR
ncbi:MAG: hypothetical protein R3F49_07285 [Planctomycetota bacterium]